MYQKMQVSGLTEIIPFICITAVWDQRPALYPWLRLTAGRGRHGHAAPPPTPPSTPVPPAAQPLGGVGVGVGWGWLMAVDRWHCSSGSQKFTFERLKSLRTVTSLFTDMAGNIPFHKVIRLIPIQECAKQVDTQLTAEICSICTSPPCDILTFCLGGSADNSQWRTLA